MKRFLKSAVLKYGTAIATCAFAVVTVAANTPCWGIYYEPQEPAGLDRFKKFSR